MSILTRLLSNMLLLYQIFASADYTATSTMTMNKYVCSYDTANSRFNTSTTSLASSITSISALTSVRTTTKVATTKVKSTSTSSKTTMSSKKSSTSPPTTKSISSKASKSSTISRGRTTTSPTPAFTPFAIRMNSVPLSDQYLVVLRTTSPQNVTFTPNLSSATEFVLDPISNLLIVHDTKLQAYLDYLDFRHGPQQFAEPAYLQQLWQDDVYESKGYNTTERFPDETCQLDGSNILTCYEASSAKGSPFEAKYFQYCASDDTLDIGIEYDCDAATLVAIYST